MDDEHRKIYARLTANAALSEAQIKANPIHHLTRAAERIRELEGAIDDALALLHGLDDYDISRDVSPDMSPGMVETALARNGKAYDHLRAVRN